jgi:hypothetical protein
VLSCFDLETGEATSKSGGRQGRNINDKYSHTQKRSVYFLRFGPLMGGGKHHCGEGIHQAEAFTEP